MHMKKFSELVSNDGLVLLTCSICIGEVEKHIKTDLERAVRELNKALQKESLRLYGIMIYIKKNWQRWMKHMLLML